MTVETHEKNVPNCKKIVVIRTKLAYFAPKEEVAIKTIKPVIVMGIG